MKITEEKIEVGNPAEILDSLNLLEDAKPKKGTKVYKEWEQKILDIRKAYNLAVGRKDLNETKI